MSDNITNQVKELQLEYDSIFNKVSKFLNWQKSEEWKRADMPKIDESHKEILFVKWDSRLKEAEQAMEDAAVEANSVIDCINENLHKANLVAKTTPGFIPEAQKLQVVWKQASEEREEAIKQVNRLNWEAYWQYLVKPHSQWMTLKSLMTSVEKIVPTLTNVIFAGQLNVEVGQLTLLKPMLDICDLKNHMQD